MGGDDRTADPNVSPKSKKMTSALSDTGYLPIALPIPFRPVPWKRCGRANETSHRERLSHVKYFTIRPQHLFRGYSRRWLKHFAEGTAHLRTGSREPAPAAAPHADT